MQPYIILYSVVVLETMVLVSSGLEAKFGGLGLELSGLGLELSGLGLDTYGLGLDYRSWSWS